MRPATLSLNGRIVMKLNDDADDESVAAYTPGFETAESPKSVRSTGMDAARLGARKRARSLRLRPRSVSSSSDVFTPFIVAVALDATTLLTLARATPLASARASARA